MLEDQNTLKLNVSLQSETRSLHIKHNLYYVYNMHLHKAINWVISLIARFFFFLQTFQWDDVFHLPDSSITKITKKRPSVCIIRMRIIPRRCDIRNIHHCSNCRPCAKKTQHKITLNLC